MSGYIKKIRANQEDLHKEINYRKQIREIMKNLIEKIKWMDETLKNLEKKQR